MSTDRETTRIVRSWLEDGAHVYVCGDLARMAVDVDRALHEIIAEQAGCDREEAADHVRRLVAERRYARDVY